MTHHLLTVLAVVLLAFAVGACDGDREVHAEPTPIAVSDECREAFEDAVAAFEETADPDDEAGHFAGSGIGTGSLSDMRPTLVACDTTSDWFEAYRGTWTERTEGISPTQALRTLCDLAPDEEMRDAAVCRQIVIDGPEEQPGEQ